MSAFSYAALGGPAPAYYKCEHCKAHGVKLWREYQTMCPTLLCGPCAMADFEQLSAWSRERPGQAIVCEQLGADWLPFLESAKARGMSGERSTLLWSNCPLPGQLQLWARPADAGNPSTNPSAITADRREVSHGA